MPAQVSSKEYPYKFHRTALAPMLPKASAADLLQASATAAQLGETTFAQFLLEQGLAPLWDDKIQRHGDNLPLSTAFRDSIHQSRLHTTGNYLLQRNSLVKIRQILDHASVPHAVIKGAHTRERYYDEPALRPAADLDVLIPRELDKQAIEAFQRAGFTFHGVPDNISHECSLVKGNTSVDLHWDILRPGRTRLPMAQNILDTRQDYGSHWGPNEDADLYLLLVHPVFTKYLTTPQATLVRQLDLAFLLEKGTPDWATVAHWLDASGLKTAGWLSLVWLKLLTGVSAPETVMSALQPGTLKQRYLQHWLYHNLSSRWLDHPALSQLGFTLPAHDTWRDSLRAMRVARDLRKAGPAILVNLDKQLS